MDALPLHPIRRAIVLPEHQLIFVPTPKTGCTTVLWHLAEDVLGLDRRTFRSAVGGEVSAALAIHSRRHWPDENVPGPERVLAALEAGWAWMTVVRDPYRRLWSAWQSKILLEEPFFRRAFSREPWYPSQVTSAEQVRAAFHAFVLALDSPAPPRDIHWDSQFDYLRPDLIAYSHMGRTENLDATIDLVLSVCGARATSPGRVENRMPIPFDPSLYDDEMRAVVQRLHAEDFASFGYSTDLPAGDADTWHRTVETLVPAVVLIRERSRRINTLQRRLARMRSEGRRSRRG